MHRPRVRVMVAGMVALNPRHLAELVGPGRLGFIATNGLQDTVVIEGAQEDEYRLRIKEGWRVAELRPICRSINPKLIHTHPALLKARAYSYTLVILEHPLLRKAPAATPPDPASPVAAISADPPPRAGLAR
ncbi:MAG: hypothetical protein ABII82_13115 [Verrucomicrobiota bacterium]